MKDKVKQLAEQAGFVFWGDEEWKPKGQVIDWSSVYDKELEKFLDLAVRECIGVVNKRYMGDNNREDMEVRRCVEDLKKHFELNDE